MPIQMGGCLSAKEPKMNPKKEIERHRLPCGPMSVSVDGVCRRKLRDHFDSLLDRLTQETHPEGVDTEILEMEEEVEIPEVKEPEETDKEKKERLIKEGKLKADVKKEVQKYEEKLMGNSKMLQSQSGKIAKR
jgi:hypothetical protein